MEWQWIMTKFSFIGGVLTVLSLCMVADASHCTLQIRSSNVTYGHHNVQRVVAATYVPVYVPQYSLQYVPQGQNNQQLLQELKAMKAEIQALKVQKQRVEPNTAPHKKVEENPINNKTPAIVMRSCAKCHDSKVANTKGGKLVLTDGGKLAEIGDSDDRLAIINAVMSRTMPRDGQLDNSPNASTNQEITDITFWYSRKK